MDNSDTLAEDVVNSIVLTNQGWTLLVEGDHDQAVEHFCEALRLDPESHTARAGLVEALKARNPIYRFFLLYFLWLGKLSHGMQVLVIVGGYITYLVLHNVAAANPAWQPWIGPILTVYLLWALMTWLADPLFTLFLRTKRVGWLALSREQTRASNLFGVCLLMTVGLIIAYLVLDDWIIICGVVVFGLLLVPVHGTYHRMGARPRRGMVIYTTVLAILGIGGFGLMLAGDFIGNNLLGLLAKLVGICLVALFVLGILVYKGIAMGLFLARRY